MRKRLLQDIQKRLENMGERWVFPNGMIVVAREDRSVPLCSVQLWVKTGSLHEGSYLGTGVSHFVEHMVFKGTEHYGCEEITDSLQRKGGIINAYTAFDRTVYHTDIPSDSWESVVDILAELAFSATLPEDAFSQERSVILREIDMDKDDPEWQLGQALLRTAFQRHPYRYPVIGARTLFEALSHGDLSNYYRARYMPNNSAWVIVGDISLQRVNEKLQEIAAKYPQRRLLPPVVEQELPQLAKRTVRVYGDYQVARGSLAFKIPGLGHEDSPALDALAHLLGQGYSSHLWQILREQKRYVHAIDASAWNPGETGLFWIHYTCDPKHCAAVENLVIKVLQSAPALLNEGDLRKFQCQACVAELNSQKTIKGQAARLGTAEVIMGDLLYPKHYLEKIHNLKLDDLAEKAALYFQEDRLTTALSLPYSANKKQTTQKTATKAPPPFEMHLLSNGVRLLCQPWHALPKVHIRVASLGGPLYEPQEARGATPLLATLLTKDTQKRAAHVVQKKLESNGAYFDSFSGNNSLGLYLEALSGDLRLATDILEEALLHPVFDPKTFQKEKDAQMAQLKEQKDDALCWGEQLLRRHFFAGHPYSFPILGDEETLAHLRKEAVEQLYNRYLCADNLVVTVTGDCTTEQVLARLAPLFSKIPEKPFVRQEPPFERPVAGCQKIELTKEQAQTLLLWGFPAVGVTSENLEVLQLMDELCSGMSSNLFKNVRERSGLAYFVGAGQLLGVNTGMFYFYAGTHPKAIPSIWSAFEGEVKYLQDGIFAKDTLEAVKTRVKTQKQQQLQTIGGRASEATFNVLYGRDANEYRTYASRIDAITKDQIQAIAGKLLDEKRSVQLAIMPKAAEG